jgi:hypothetical protein
MCTAHFSCQRAARSLTGSDIRQWSPREDVYNILQNSHVDESGKHIGIQRTYLAVSTFRGIPRLLVFRFVDACPSYATKRSRQQRQAPDIQARSPSSGSSTQVGEYGCPEPTVYKVNFSGNKYIRMI